MHQRLKGHIESDAFRLSEAILVLTSISEAAAGTREDMQHEFGVDKGGPNRTIDWLVYGSPRVRLIKSAISLFDWVNGRASVTAYKDGATYFFADAVHYYAIGKPLGMRKQFQSLVKEWKVRTVNDGR